MYEWLHFRPNSSQKPKFFLLSIVEVDDNTLVEVGNSGKLRSIDWSQRSWKSKARI